jgi:uncharacterized protein (TIRG00374 family)
MKLFRLLFLLLGLGLFAFVLAQADLSAVADHVGRLGWDGALVIPAVSLLPFVVDTWSWQVLFTPPRSGWRWFADLWKIRAVGTAISKLTPVVGVAGEPVKALLLKRIYGLPYREGIASLLVAKTANLIALVIFLGIGLALSFGDDRLPNGYRLAAAVGFAALAFSIGAFFLVQRLRISSALGGWLSRGALGHHISRALHPLRELDDRLVLAYTRDWARFLAATFLTFLNWVFGVVELYLIFWFMSHPVGIADAIIIAATVELVRAGIFFIPASIGAEEAALTVIVTAITGENGLGLAVAFVRRYRELLWIGYGVWIAWRMTGQSLTPIGTMLRASEDERLSR